MIIASKGTSLKTIACDISTHFTSQQMAWLCLLGQSISPLLFLLWWTASAVLIQEVVKGYKLLFIHTPVLLEQSMHQGERSQDSTTQFQNLFKCHPRKTDVGNQPHVCARNFFSVSVTCAREVWKAKCENWVLSKETDTLGFGKAQGTLWGFCRRLSTDVFIPYDFPHENNFETRKVTLFCDGSYPS